MKAVGASEREALLKKIPAWKYKTDQKAIEREFRFTSFGACFAFMTRVAFLAESMNHHPEFFQCYSRLKILLTTHDIDGISSLDLEMAQKIDKMSTKCRNIHTYPEVL